MYYIKVNTGDDKEQCDKYPFFTKRWGNYRLYINDTEYIMKRDEPLYNKEKSIYVYSLTKASKKETTLFEKYIKLNNL